jgi:hypothetical protein
VTGVIYYLEMAMGNRTGDCDGRSSRTDKIVATLDDVDRHGPRDAARGRQKLTGSEPGVSVEVVGLEDRELFALFRGALVFCRGSQLR